MSNGKRKAATFGQDLMRGEHVVGGGSVSKGKGLSGTTNWMNEKGLSGGCSAQRHEGSCQRHQHL
jgi:hypothetical protein